MSDFEDFLIDFIEDNKSSKLIVDKKEYSITSTKEIRIEDDSIYINGDKIKIEANDSKINITIIGNIENLNINRCNNFKVEGNIKTVLFPIICDSLVGNIEKVNGTVKTNILNGNIEEVNGTTVIENINGNITKVNGNIITKHY
jgi:hypothetical protein